MKLDGFRHFDLAVYASNDIVSGSICSSGSWEFQDPTIFGPPGHFLDIGANVGVYSFALAAADWNVTAFEPMARNQELMTASFCKNPALAERVALISVGLGPKNDECTIYSDNANVGDGSTVCGSTLPNCTGLSAGCSKLGHFSQRRLDDVLVEQKVTNVDFVKMDTEGYECMVMQGAPTLLTKFRPRLIQSEVWSDETSCHGGPEGFLAMFAANHAYKVSMTRGCPDEHSWSNAEGHIQNYFMCRAGLGMNTSSLLEGPRRRVPFFLESAEVNPASL